MYSYSFIDCEKAQKPCLPDGTTKTKRYFCCKKTSGSSFGKREETKVLQYMWLLLRSSEKKKNYKQKVVSNSFTQGPFRFLKLNPAPQK